MNQYTKNIIYIIIGIMFINITKTYACDEDAIPIMTSTPNTHVIYMSVDGTKTFGSDSYDPDDDEPFGGNHGIANLKWDVYRYSYPAGYIAEWVESSSFTFTPSAYDLVAGYYSVDLNVLDNDHTDENSNYIRGWYVYDSDPERWYGTRDVCLLDIEYFNDINYNETHYVPYGTGETFYYSLLPDSDWEPDALHFYIKDDEDNMVCWYWAFGSMTEILLESEIYWDGYSNYGSYSGSPLPPGNYTVTLDARKSNAIMQKTNDMFIVEVDRVIKNNSSPEDLGPLYTADGSIELKAIPNPSVSFPEDQPLWTCIEYPGYNFPYISNSGIGNTVTVSGMSCGKNVIKSWCGTADTGDTIDIYMVDVVIDIPASFPAYVPVNENLSLGCTPLGATGGTYKWTASGPGTPGSVTFSPSDTAEDPTFKASQPGNYTVTVEYTIGDVTVSSTSDTITVYKVDVTNLTTNPYTIGVGDVVVSYTISPAGFTADTAVIEIRDKDNTLAASGSSISKTGGSHTVTWSGSTASLRSVHWEKDPYVAKITIAKGSTSTYDTTNMTVNQSTAVVVAETSAKTGLPLTECMEGRHVTFKATATGFVSTTTDPIDFRFCFREADGTFWYDTEWSWDLIHDYTAEADDVLDGDDDHYFDTPIYVEVEDNFGHLIVSSDISLRVWELYIEYFRDNDSGVAKPWKVVVGKNIAYSATSSPDCTNWSWDMPEGVPDKWNPTGGNAKSGTTMKIPYSDLSGANGDWFGTQYGQVKVFCEDEEGNNHTFYSTSMNLSDFPAGWGTEKKAKVFFDPGRSIVGGPPSQTYHPCWYLFWKNGAVPGLEDFEYDHSLGEYGWGSSQYNPFGLDVRKVGPAAGPSITYPNAGIHYPVAIFPPTGLIINGTNFSVFGVPPAPITGIDCCAEVVVHENKHNFYAAEIYGGAADNDPATPVFPNPGDRIADAREAAIGCNTAMKDTFGVAAAKGAAYGDYGDGEYAVLLDSHGTQGVDSKDWSKGGKQW